MSSTTGGGSYMDMTTGLDTAYTVRRMGIGDPLMQNNASLRTNYENV